MGPKDEAKIGDRDMAEQADKFDSGKTPWELLPMDALEEVAKVLQFGAEKYEAWNWTKGMAYSRLVGATCRHLLREWWCGRRVDEETGLSHIAHAICCLLFLLAYELRGIGTDDGDPSLTGE